MRLRSVFPNVVKASWCLLGIVVLVLAAGCEQSVKDLRTEGIQQFRDRQHMESMASLRFALQKDPNDAEANYYMGMNYRALAEQRSRAGDMLGAFRTIDVAVMYFTQAVKTWPNYMAAVQAKTEALEMRGKYDAALAAAERVSDNNRGIADHFIFLGDQYRARGDYDNALRAYNTALATRPNDARVYASIGKMYQQAGNHEEAVAAFKRASQLDNGPPDANDRIAEQGTQPGQDAVAGNLPPQVTPEEPTPTAPRIYSGKK